MPDGGRGGAGGDLGWFRGALYRCLTARADALFELADAVLCADGPVRSLPGLSLVAEHRRGHGALYDALGAGRVDVDRLRTAVASVPLPRAGDGRIVLALDVTCWLRPEAGTVPERILCHTYGRAKDQHIGVPGWPYSFVVALETGRSSWTAPLDAVRLTPGADLAVVTAGQVRGVLARLIAAGHWRPGDPQMWVVMDAGYDAARLAWLLRDLPVRVLARLRRQLDALTAIMADTTTDSERDVLLRQAEMIQRSAQESVPDEPDLADVRGRYEAALAAHARKTLS